MKNKIIKDEILKIKDEIELDELLTEIYKQKRNNNRWTGSGTWWWIIN